MNKEIILSYVKLYKNILKQHQILLSEQDLSNIYQLILLVFELDDLYDLGDRYPPSPHQLASVKTAMIALIPDRNSIGLQAVEFLFQGMQEESLFSTDSTLTLERYLQVCSQSIGASILTAYLASKINVNLNIWQSKTIVKFNNQINILIRLANDYLDTDIDLTRTVRETKQIKALHFFNGKAPFKRYLISRLIRHKLNYYYYRIRFQYLKLATNWQEYYKAIACSESVLDWALKVYLIDRNSCQ